MPILFSISEMWLTLPRNTIYKIYFFEILGAHVEKISILVSYESSDQIFQSLNLKII